MPKLRTKKTTNLALGPVIKVFLICSFICTLAVFYVWQKNLIFNLGRQISDHEKKLEQLREDNEALRDQEYLLASQKMIAERVTQLKLDLGPVQPDQMVWISDPGVLPPGARQWAGRVAGKTGVGN